MKSIIHIVIGIILFNSCQTNNYGKDRMDNFIQNYRNDFINSDLKLYNYNPRVKFEKYSDSVNYRMFIRPDNKLLVSSWIDSTKQFDTTDIVGKFVIDLTQYLSKNSKDIEAAGIKEIEWITKDSSQRLVLLGVENTKYTIQNKTFDFDPIEYFSKLETQINSFGVLSIMKHKNYWQLIFDSENSLFYFPKIEYSDTTDLNLKRIDDFWYFSNDETDTDFY